MVFSGLNSLFHWVKIPPSGPVIDKFVEACTETKFIMPTVKTIEILFGLFLILGFLVPVSLVMFAPVMVVITGLHLLHNPKPWSILGLYTFPYIVLLIMHGESILRLVH